MALKKFRQGTDIPIELVLRPGTGQQVDWSQVVIEALFVRADAYGAVSGHLDYRVDASDSTILHAVWDAADQPYTGVCSVIGKILIGSQEVTFDAPVVEIVPTSAEADADNTAFADVEIAAGDVVVSIMTNSSGLIEEADPTVPQHVKDITQEDISGWDAKGTYSKPSGGIPKGDLSSAVQSSLGKADTAVQDVSGKQDVISDLEDIRSGAAAGATAVQDVSGLATKSEVSGKYSKPSGGIPKSDLASAVQSSLDKAESAVQDVSGLASKSEVNAKYSKPSSGIPKTDLASAVQASLGKADTAIQSHQSIDHLATKSEVSGKYSKPSGGIPKGDLSSSVQSSLDKADTAVQDVSGKQDVISDLEDIRSGAAAGATAIQSHQQLKTLNGQSLVGPGNIVITPGTGGGGGGISEESDPTVPYYVKDITQEDISGWGAKYSKPSGGIPKGDLSSSVQSSLDKADTAVQDVSGLATKSEVSAKQDVISDLEDIRSGAAAGATAVQDVSGLATKSEVNAKYSKPSSGIPKTDLASAVQSSLDKADTAVQDVSGLATKSEVNAKQDVISDLEDIRSGAAAGATAIQSHQQLKTVNGQSIVGSGNVEIESGPSVTVDAAMSDTSTNPVQNKVVKGYVDGELEGVEEIVDAINGTVSGVTDVTHFTIGEGLVVENGVLKCSFVPTRYYTGSSAPIDTQGNNGDLYFQIDS